MPCDPLCVIVLCVLLSSCGLCVYYEGIWFTVWISDCCFVVLLWWLVPVCFGGVNVDCLVHVCDGGLMLCY